MLFEKIKFFPFQCSVMERTPRGARKRVKERTALVSLTFKEANVCYASLPSFNTSSPEGEREKSNCFNRVFKLPPPPTVPSL